MWLAGLHARPWPAASTLSGGRGGEIDRRLARVTTSPWSASSSLSLPLSLSVLLLLSLCCGFPVPVEREREIERQRRRAPREGGGNSRRKWLQANPTSTHTYAHTHTFLYSRKPCGRGGTAALHSVRMFRSAALLYKPNTAEDELPKDGTHAAEISGTESPNTDRLHECVWWMFHLKRLKKKSTCWQKKIFRI